MMPIPPTDALIPSAATLLAVTPAFVGVVVALVAAMAVTIRAILGDLERPPGPRTAVGPGRAAPAPRLAA
jgi:hypothetical protein